MGMGQIEMPVVIDWSGSTQHVPALINATVSLDEEKAKGIHMSRLYITLKKLLKDDAVNLNLLKSILAEFVESQKGLSQSATVELKFDYLVMRKALKSSEEGWRSYPIKLKAVNDNGQVKFYCSVPVSYTHLTLPTTPYV